MRVVQFADYGPPEVLHEAEVPTPEPGPGRVRIRVRATAVNPADAKWRAGMFQSLAPIPLPHVPGYDVAGDIDALGEGVGCLAVGDPVFAKLDAVTKGGYADYAVIPAAHAVPMPAGLDYATAAAIPTAGLTGTQMVDEDASVGAGDVVLVTGAVGAVGRFAVHGARNRGARVVAAVRASQVDEGRSIGASDVVVLGGQDWEGPAFNFVLDTVGGQEVGMLCRHLAPGGQIFTAATTPIESEELAIEPAFVMIRDNPAKLAQIAEAVAGGEIVVPIARRLPLSEAVQAHHWVERGGTGGKIVLTP